MTATTANRWRVANPYCTTAAGHRPYNQLGQITCNQRVKVWYMLGRAKGFDNEESSLQRLPMHSNVHTVTNRGGTFSYAHLHGQHISPPHKTLWSTQFSGTH